MCENLSQDELTNHVCQLKIPSDCESDSNENEFGGLRMLESNVRYEFVIFTQVDIQVIHSQKIDLIQENNF